MLDSLKTRYYLGIDWGKQKTGLAIADSELMIAKALKEVSAQDLEKEIDNLYQEYKFSLIVLGFTEPQNKFNSENKNQVSMLAMLLEGKGYAVQLENEMFSTQMAQRNLANQGIKVVSKKDNAESARLILQSYLDRIYRDSMRNE